MPRGPTPLSFLRPPERPPDLTRPGTEDSPHTSKTGDLCNQRSTTVLDAESRKPRIWRGLSNRLHCHPPDEVCHLFIRHTHSKRSKLQQLILVGHSRNEPHGTRAYPCHPRPRVAPYYLGVVLGSRPNLPSDCDPSSRVVGYIRRCDPRCARRAREASVGAQATPYAPVCSFSLHAHPTHV